MKVLLWIPAYAGMNGELWRCRSEHLINSFQQCRFDRAQRQARAAPSRSTVLWSARRSAHLRSWRQANDASRDRLAIPLRERLRSRPRPEFETTESDAPRLRRPARATLLAKDFHPREYIARLHAPAPKQVSYLLRRHGRRRG